VAHLVESAKLAVRAAAYAGEEVANRGRGAGRVPAGNELRAFLARMLGWSNERAVDLALRSLALAPDHRAALVLCGEGDLVPIAWALHRHTLGRIGRSSSATPGAVQRRHPCDRQQAAPTASPRSRRRSAARCVRSRRLPGDFSALVARLRDADDVLCAICTAAVGRPAPAARPFSAAGGPPLAQRVAELDRIIAEYAGDTIEQLAAPASSFTAGDHAWVRDHAAASLADIEKATLRLVAIRTSRSRNGAAARLGMAVTSRDKKPDWSSPDDADVSDSSSLTAASQELRGP
jgi:hypothetical protein